MTEKKLSGKIANTESELIGDEKTIKQKRKNFTLRKLIIFSACTVLIIGIIFFLFNIVKSKSGALIDVDFPKNNSFAFNDSEAKELNLTNNPVDDAFFTEINKFSYKTASQIFTSNNGNINYSPISLYYSLALAASGANGKTADELLSLLGVSDKNNLSVQCSNLYRRLYRDNEFGKLKIANSIWMDSYLKFNDNFVKNAAESFYAYSFSKDFSDSKTNNAMAKWISDNTNGTISPTINISPNQTLSINNTVYFYSEWFSEFNERNTAEDTFFLSNGNMVNCDYMNRNIVNGEFTKGGGFTRSAIGLKNDTQMVFILPDEGVSPIELLSTPENMKATFEGGKESIGKVIWKIPKFSFGSKLDLSDTLKTLDVNSAFRQDADFSGITDQMAFLSNIVQETHIGIDENGVEAAACTFLDFATAGKEKDNRAEMILNRPFIYGIKELDGTLLFVGICDNPVLK